MSLPKIIIIFAAVLTVLLQCVRVFSLEAIGCITVTTNVQSQMHFYLRTNAQQTSQEVFLNDSESLMVSTFNPNLPIRFLVHDWQENASSDVNEVLTRGFLDSGAYNIFVVDWGRLATTYLIASSFVKDVGRAVGQFLEFLESLRYSLSSTHLIGFGLGAHICGFAGKYMGSKPFLIIGADPTGSIYEAMNRKCRLSITDARYVLVIHSAVNSTGIKKSIGHVDFYINYGVAISVDATASHRASYKILAKSFNPDNEYFGKNCGNDYRAVTEFRDCSGTGPQVKFGGIPIDTSIRGIYNIEVDPNSLR